MSDQAIAPEQVEQDKSRPDETSKAYQPEDEPESEDEEDGNEDEGNEDEGASGGAAECIMLDACEQAVLSKYENVAVVTVYDHNSGDMAAFVQCMVCRDFRPVYVKWGGQEGGVLYTVDGKEVHVHKGKTTIFRSTITCLRDYVDRGFARYKNVINAIDRFLHQL